MAADALAERLVYRIPSLIAGRAGEVQRVAGQRVGLLSEQPEAIAAAMPVRRLRPGGTQGTGIVAADIGASEIEAAHVARLRHVGILDVRKPVELQPGENRLEFQVERLTAAPRLSVLPVNPRNDGDTAGRFEVRL